jgi:protein-disulfide isomerase
MMKKLLLAGLLAATSLTAGASLAEDKKPDISAAQQAEGRQILETARALESYGEAKGDPLALVTAAKMVASVPGRVLADGQQGDKGANFDIEAVLKKAEGLAQGDELITKVAGDVRTMAEANSKAVCYWQYYCYWNGYCEYAYYCY